MRLVHRYLGFFLAGIMAMYSISGIILIFRDTDFLKQEKQISKQLNPHLNAEQLGRELRIRGLKIDKQEESILYFRTGTYDQSTGEAKYMKKELPFFLNKMTKIHKANSKSPLFWLNIFFGISLFFFVISAFWMYRPRTSIFRKGMYFTLGGIILTVILLFF